MRDDNYEGAFDFAVLADLEDVTAPPRRPDMIVTGLELTQAIQFFRSAQHLDAATAEPDNIIPLIAGKDLGVRTYVDHDLCASPSPVGSIYGIIRLTRSSGVVEDVLSRIFLDAAEPNRSFASETAPQAGKPLLRRNVLRTRRATIEVRAPWRRAYAAVFVNPNGLLRIVSESNERLGSELPEQSGAHPTRYARVADRGEPSGAGRQVSAAGAVRSAPSHRSRKARPAIPRGHFRACDPRRSALPPAHLCAWRMASA